MNPFPLSLSGAKSKAAGFQAWTLFDFAAAAATLRASGNDFVCLYECTKVWFSLVVPTRRRALNLRKREKGVYHG